MHSPVIVPVGTEVTSSSIFRLPRTPTQAAAGDAGTLVNPTTVRLLVRSPAGVITTYTTGQLTNPSTGVFERSFIVSAEGRWSYRWESDGNVRAGTADGEVVGRLSVFYP